MRTWSFLGAARVLHASAWRGEDEGGGEGDEGDEDGGRAGTRGEGVRVGAGRGGRSSDEGWCRWAGPCSCPSDRSEVHTPLACLADFPLFLCVLLYKMEVTCSAIAHPCPYSSPFHS